jgi:hypothetical protein
MGEEAVTAKLEVPFWHMHGRTGILLKASVGIIYPETWYFLSTS